MPEAVVLAEIEHRTPDQKPEPESETLFPKKQEPTPVTTQSIVTEILPQEVINSDSEKVLEIVIPAEEIQVAAPESPPTHSDINLPVSPEDAIPPSLTEYEHAPEKNDVQTLETEEKNNTPTELSISYPEASAINAPEDVLLMETKIPEEVPATIQSMPTEVEKIDVLEQVPLEVVFEEEVSQVEIADVPMAETVDSNYEVDELQSPIESLESFETFVNDLHDTEATPEKLEVVHEKVEKIHELTKALQEAELLDSYTAVEKIQEELVQTFIELFAETGIEVSEDQVRKLVQLWIQHDVLNSVDFDAVRNELFDDKGMHEILKQFMHGLAYIKEFLESIQTRLGRLVISDIQKLSLAH